MRLRFGTAALFMNYFTEIILAKCSLSVFESSNLVMPVCVVLKRLRFWQALFWVIFNC